MTEKDKETIHQIESEDERITAEDVSVVIYPINSRMDKMKKEKTENE